MYIKLSKALLFNKVKIKESYKHLQYLIDQDIVEPIMDGYQTFGKAVLPTHSDYYQLTTIGKEKYFTFSNQLFTWVIAVSALVISLLAYFKK